MISLTSKILILIFLSASMLSIGLQVHFKDFSLLLKRKLLLLKSLAANFIIVPIVGIVITMIFPLPPEVSLAFIVLALTPGGLSALQFGTKIKGESAYIGFIVLILSVLAAFISPYLISFFLPKGIVLVIPYWRMLLFLTVFLFLPMLLGILVQYRVAEFAYKISKLFAWLGTIAFVAMIIFTLETRREAISAHALQIVLIMLLFIFLTMLIGWLMGGPERKDRQALTIITSMRNVAICLVIAMETMPQAKVITPLVALSALMVFPNMLFTLFAVFWGKFMIKYP
jgi:BASS family bile acid:Na+ symporter